VKKITDRYIKILNRQEQDLLKLMKREDKVLKKYNGDFDFIYGYEVYGVSEDGRLMIRHPDQGYMLIEEKVWVRMILYEYAAYFRDEDEAREMLTRIPVLNKYVDTEMAYLFPGEYA